MGFTSSACAFLLGFAASASTPQGVILHSAAELNNFSEDSSRRYTPFSVTGTVQNITQSVPRQYLIFSDKTGWTEVRNDSGYTPTLGEVIAIKGRAHMSQHREMEITAAEITSLGEGKAEPPLELPLSELSEDKHHLRTVITQGTVIDTFPDEIDDRNHFLILKEGATIIPVALGIDPDFDPDLEPLRDARVRVVGRFMRTICGSRKFSGPFILADGRDNLTVIDPALEDSFSAPRLENVLYRTPKEIASRGKRSITGEVLAVWNDNRLMLAEGERIINITLAHGQAAPSAGDIVTAAGYPETDLYRVNLTRAVVRVEKHQQISETEPAITNLESVFGGIGGPNAIDAGCHGRMLRVRGIVRNLPTSDSSSHRMLLACGRHKLSVDLGSFPNAASDIVLGSKIEVSGRCLLEIDSWNPADIFPRIRNLVVVIRTPADLHVLSRPSWWTPMKLLVVISILFTALVAVYIWNRILQKLVTLRGRELYREQVAHAVAEFKTGERTRLAVELHDSLSQSLAGVACHVAACAKTLEHNPSVARRCLDTADKILNSCRTELRQCLFDLRSETLEEANFATAIKKTLDQLDGNAAIGIRFNVSRRKLKDTAAHAVLSIIRELTGNAIRHGHATEVKIAGCVENGQLVFSVRDNGCGFSPENCDGPQEGHFGLEGIRNRLEKLNGSLQLESSVGHGTRATITFPLLANQSQEDFKS